MVLTLERVKTNFDLNTLVTVVAHWKKKMFWGAFSPFFVSPLHIYNNVGCLLTDTTTLIFAIFEDLHIYEVMSERIIEEQINPTYSYCGQWKNSWIQSPRVIGLQHSSSLQHYLLIVFLTFKKFHNLLLNISKFVVLLFSLRKIYFLKF